MNFKISNLEFFKSVISTVSFENLYNNKQSIYFIIINIVVAFLGFVRSFAFMKFLDLKELGFLTLIQTGAMLIGFFQIGLINGGYRILALQDSKLSKDTNNVLFSYFGILFIVLLGIYAIGSITGLITENLIVFITILIGLFALLNNWIINMLIASREYDRLNKANLLSVLLSVACLPLAYFYGIYGGAISLLIQPLALVIFVLLTGRNLWINKFSISVLKLKNILHYGFIPYLSGLFFLSYMQIERWSIASYLGTTSLGSFYLVFLITSLWVLIPTSINSLFFPKAVKYYEDKDYDNFKTIININFGVILAYCFIVSLIIIVFLSPVVSFVFPKHFPFVKYALLALPGLVFRTLSDPISLFLNSVVKLKPIFWSDISGLALYSFLICFFVLLHSFTLNAVVICFDIYYGYKLFYLLISYFRLKKQVLL